MSEEGVVRRLQDMGLLPHQADVVQGFVAKGSEVRGMLQAAPGMGKSTMAAALISEFIQANPQARCAFVTGPSLLTQSSATLAKWLGDVSVFPVSARTFRAIRGTTQDSSGDPWPRPAVALWSFDGLKTSAVIRQAWATFSADLLVVDEAHRLLEPGADVVGAAMDSVPAVLAMTAVRSEAVEARLNGGDRLIRWTWALPIRDWGGHVVGAMSSVNHVLIDYSRDAEEMEIFRLIQACYGEPDPENIGAMAVHLAAGSSLFALESMLLRRRNQLAHHILQPGEMDPDQPAELDALPSEAWAAKEPVQELALLQTLLERLASLRADSKLAAFLDLVERLALERADEIAVFTKYIRTQDLLEQALEDREFEVVKVNGSMSPEARDAAIGAAGSGRTVLLLTDAALQGLDLRNVRHAIHFDLPRTAAQMAVRESRLGGFGGAANSITVFALHDRLGFPMDQRTLREASFIES